MRVLLTNDDGFNADGIQLLKSIVSDFATDIWIVAPLSDKSGTSRSIILQRPINIYKNSEKEFLVDGTPAECVFLALNNIIPEKYKPDLILSGINIGSNIGSDVVYSGTVGAAMEGAAFGIPSIALSQAYQNKDIPINWHNAKSHSLKIIKHLLKKVHKWKDSVMNINFPANEVFNGIKFVKQGSHNIKQYKFNSIENKIHEDGTQSCTIHKNRPESGECDKIGDGSVELLHAGFITITPLKSDLTDYNTLEFAKECSFEI